MAIWRLNEYILIGISLLGDIPSLQINPSYRINLQLYYLYSATVQADVTRNIATLPSPGRYAQLLKNITMNYWLTILEAFREGRFPKYYYGLTPRFIIGGCQSPVGEKFKTGELAYEATKQMFDEMHSFNNNGKVVVSINCGIHKGKVMALSEME